MAEQVLTERRGGVLVITINRPEARNALNQVVGERVSAAIDELESDPDLRVAVLTGAGGNFSSGLDLKGWLKGESPSVAGRGLCGMTMKPPAKPVIAAVEGWALAGGFELLLACDMVVASETARFGVPEVKRSLVAGGGGAMLLAQRIPLAVALEVLLTGDPLSVTRAADLGLVNRVTPEGAALDGALELARVIAANGPMAVAATKRIARESADWTFEEGWSLQKAIYEPVFASADAKEGAAAFAEKRAPVWKGR